MSAWEQTPMVEVQNVCSYINDDRKVANYFRVDPQFVAVCRANMKRERLKRTELSTKREGDGANTHTEFCEDARNGSARLYDALSRMFHRFEKEHGLQPGAGKILLPAGWGGWE